MNKFETLVKTSQYLWVVATFLMLLSWFRISDYAFRNVHYIIEDKFIYIGILGGWLFVWIFYSVIIFFIGYHIIGLIKRISDAKEVLPA